jgi:hypothetical protein
MLICRRLSISLLACLAHLACAHAHVICQRIEQLPMVSNAATLALFDVYLRSDGASQRPSLRQLDERLLIAFPADEDCKGARCYYRLLAVDDDAIRERLSFRGTGVMLIYTAGMRIDRFRDVFFTVSFEVADQVHLEVAFAGRGRTVLVSPVTPVEIKLPRC